MKKILILLAAIYCCGCENDIPKIRKQAFITETNFIGPIDERVAVFQIEYNGHEYIAFRQWGGIFKGIVHSPDCPCKMK